MVKPVTNLSLLPDLGGASLELLEAAGFSDAETLAKTGVDALTQELSRANAILKITAEAPTRERIAAWIASAREMVGMSEEDYPDESAPTNYEVSPRVVRMLASAPFAIPLPAQALIEQNLGVGDIPPALLLNRYSGQLDARGEDQIPSSKQGRTALPATNVQLAEPDTARLELDIARLKTTEVLGGAPRVSTPKDEPVNERLALLRGPLPETNRGRSPKSRFYVRGVLHTHPIGLAMGAVVTLLLLFVLPVSVVSAALLLLSGEVPGTFGWVPKWLLVFPLALPVLALAYLIWGLNGSCRICGQKQFVPKMCLKNSKAHRIPGLGYIIPVSLHMLLFKWFRCTYCGTPVRLKK